MPLAPYSEKYWYPDGSVAVGALLHVFPRASNVPAVLWADAAGTIPAPNPIPTDASGFATFWVENGNYWAYVNGQAFGLIIDLDPNLTHVWPASFRWEQPVAAAVWTIAHGLNSRPTVTVVGPGDQALIGDVQYVDDNNLTITFGTPTAGVAYLRR